MTTRLLNKLAYFSVVTPKLDASISLYRDILGLEESGRDQGSVYFRGWGEHFKYCLELKEGPVACVDTVGWRAEGPAELEAAVERIEASGRGLGWRPAAFGRGPAYRYSGPGGHEHEVFWEVERYKAPADRASTFPTRPQAYRPRGAAVREIDHVTFNTPDVQADLRWYGQTLGHKFKEYFVADHAPDRVIFAMMTTGERGHDLGLVIDAPDNKGRVNHIAFWLDQRVELYRAADVLLDAGIPIEFGPGRHGLGEQEYLYFREPGGLRVELNSGGYRNSDPDWEPVRWLASQGANVWYRNLEMPQSMYHSFPLQPGDFDGSNVKKAFAAAKPFVF